MERLLEVQLPVALSLSGLIDQARSWLERLTTYFFPFWHVLLPELLSSCTYSNQGYQLRSMQINSNLYNVQFGIDLKVATIMRNMQNPQDWRHSLLKQAYVADCHRSHVGLRFTLDLANMTIKPDSNLYKHLAVVRPGFCKPSSLLMKSGNEEKRSSACAGVWEGSNRANIHGIICQAVLWSEYQGHQIQGWARQCRWERRHL